MRLGCTRILSGSALSEAHALQKSGGDEVGPLDCALWFVHQGAAPGSLYPRNARKSKGMLSRLLSKQGILTQTGVQ